MGDRPDPGSRVVAFQAFLWVSFRVDQGAEAPKIFYDVLCIIVI
jgi:hypothetical protein